jgi:hypothetical protein
MKLRAGQVVLIIFFYYLQLKSRNEREVIVMQHQEWGIPLTKGWHIKASRPNFFVAVSTKNENDLHIVIYSCKRISKLS